MSQDSTRRTATIDGNEAIASVAYRVNQLIAIYPITPASPMGELADEWSAQARPNIWGIVPQLIEMQSEGGAAGTVHGGLQAGVLTTTFTASQGLLLMLPNMYKIAGELTAFTMHVAARTVATHALSIFGDHSDVMACRQTGFALLCSGSVQEAHDLACVAHAATLRSRIPFLHFCDGFRTSHEIAKIELLADDDLHAMMPEELLRAHRGRALTPDRPVLRGTAQNPDTFFQAREAANPFYLGCPARVQEAMDELGARTGRRYHLFDYAGHPEAERVIVVMGSAAETVHETVDWLVRSGEKVGVIKVRLFRPFSADDFVAALPRTVRAVAVLDRTKEPGALGEPLYLDVLAALHEASTLRPTVIGGRYGLASKEFTPAMVTAVFRELASPAPRRHFTIGITDDVTGLQDNVSDRTVVFRWCRNLNYDRVLPIVAELDGKLVGDATLHRRTVGPMRQIGRFRAYVRPEYRHRGIGTVLLQEIMSVARQVGLTQLAVELYEDQTALRKVFSRYGFREEGRIPVYQRVILLRDLAEEQETAGTAGEETAAPEEMTTGTMLGRDGPRSRLPGAP